MPEIGKLAIFGHLAYEVEVPWTAGVREGQKQKRGRELLIANYELPDL